jgi:two-component sensor histidine kinase
MVVSNFQESTSMLAVIALSREPLLLLSNDLDVIAASVSFYQKFQMAPANVKGRKFSDIGDGEWSKPQLGSLLKATASGSADILSYEYNLVRQGSRDRCIVFNANRLDNGEAGIQLLLTLTDVTEVRDEANKLKAALDEKAVLIREVQHRVANSLQIIASVLMQSARRVQSDEARSHLKDAHSRVMSIAAVQRYLSVSSETDVSLSTYLKQLCESLGASMIHDRTQLSIEVDVDNSVVRPDHSVRLGLIVTELVINALKHAFPDHRHGKIVVTYRSSGETWTMGVADDGVGMADHVAKPGLGTGIVEALSAQLGGVFNVKNSKPGTDCTLVCDGVSGNETEPLLAA